MVNQSDNPTEISWQKLLWAAENMSFNKKLNEIWPPYVDYISVGKVLYIRFIKKENRLNAIHFGVFSPKCII